jgi:hypothetical protein
LQELSFLTEKISKHFSIHPSRQKALTSMIFGILCSRNVHQQNLAQYVDSPNPRAALRRVERFFAKKNYPLRNTLLLSLTCSHLKENLIYVLIVQIGNLEIKTLIIWF